MGTPVVAALSGKSSKVKLTIGRALRSLNGVVQKYRDRRLLTRACNAGHSVSAGISVIRSEACFRRSSSRAFEEKADPVAEHDSGGSAGRNILPKGAVGQFRAQRRPAFGLGTQGKSREPLLGICVEIAGRHARIAIALAREEARYVSKIFTLQRQLLIFRMALEEDELTAEVLGEAVDAAPRQVRQQLVAVRGQVI